MAKSNKSKPAPKATAKPVAAPRVEVEVTEESKPAGMEAGLAITTTVLLIVAILFVDHSLAPYGAAVFFK